MSKKKKLKEKLRATRNGARPAAMVRDYDSHVLLCAGSDCKKRGSKEIRKALKGELRASGILGDVRLDTTGCLGLCKHGPNIIVYDGAGPQGSWYLGLDKDDVPDIVQKHLKDGAPVERLIADRRLRKAKKGRRKG